MSRPFDPEATRQLAAELASYEARLALDGPCQRSGLTPARARRVANLLQAGADPDARLAFDGEALDPPAISVALAGRAWDLASDLLQAGADPNACFLDPLGRRCSPLWAAARDSSCPDRIIVELLHAGADAFAPTSSCSWLDRADDQPMAPWLASLCAGQPFCQPEEPAIHWLSRHGRSIPFFIAVELDPQKAALAAEQACRQIPVADPALWPWLLVDMIRRHPLFEPFAMAEPAGLNPRAELDLLAAQAQKAHLAFAAGPGGARAKPAAGRL